ncbi:MAG: SDR family oxidoreductase [Thermodesulfovibrionales bacterium]|jgi:NAD(P)-dependent dehydrogenase (short-subunit alcohol dehydrogenase family)
MDKRVAIVTGGAVGLGREIAIALSGSDCRVCVNYHSSHVAAAKLIEELGDNVIAMRADVCKRDEVLAMVDRVVDKWGRMDIVVNNAGITKDALIVKQSEEDWDSVMAVHVKGLFNLVQTCVPRMNNGGHIINISSYSGLKGNKGQAAYSSSKAALLGLTKSAAIELAARDVKVNAVLPGYMPTGMGSIAASALERAREESLLHTLSDPCEVARFIVYLSTTKTITGQTFVFDSRIV